MLLQGVKQEKLILQLVGSKKFSLETGNGKYDELDTYEMSDGKHKTSAIMEKNCQNLDEIPPLFSIISVEDYVFNTDINTYGIRWALSWYIITYIAIRSCDVRGEIYGVEYWFVHL